MIVDCTATLRDLTETTFQQCCSLVQSDSESLSGGWGIVLLRQWRMENTAQTVWRVKNNGNAQSQTVWRVKNNGNAQTVWRVKNNAAQTVEGEE